MSLITFTQSGDFSATVKFLEKTKKLSYKNILDKYGKKGLQALQKATPKRSGKTSESWSYQVKMRIDGATITWNNSNINRGVPIAVIIQYGHGTGWGGYVQGIDYINPALTPVFNDLVEELWKEVTG